VAGGFCLPDPDQWVGICPRGYISNGYRNCNGKLPGNKSRHGEPDEVITNRVRNELKFLF